MIKAIGLDLNYFVVWHGRITVNKSDAVGIILSNRLLFYGNYWAILGQNA
jgi:hypothetical protein